MMSNLLASAAAASIRFINKLDFNFDQIGLVTYSGRANRVVQLLCLKSNGQGCTKNVIDNNILRYAQFAQSDVWLVAARTSPMRLRNRLKR